MSRPTPTHRFERARELFVRALGLGVAERAAMLERECAGDGELRALVLALLEADAEPSTGLTASGAGRVWLAGEIGAGDAEGQENEPLPRQIAGFEVVREIGRGGMGIVYEALQQEPRRRVALKVIHPGLVSTGTLKRFGREVRAMAALAHPGIVQLYGVGDPGGDQRRGPLLVMELVEGLSLRDWGASGPGVQPKLRLLAALCDAVHHAHQKGVVHRDLKPENILVVRDGAGDAAGSQEPRPKILDFGVSRLLEEDGGPNAGSLRTHVGQVVGTVPYLSPEQARGDASGADTRSDVYALGVIAFELLAGTPPFDVKGLSTTAAIRRVLDTPHRRLRSLAPALDPDVQTVVHKAMHPDADQRYASAAELAADLRRVVGNEPVLARAPSVGYVTRKFVRRHRVLAGVVGVSAVLLLASVVAIALAWADARRTREAAVWQRYLSAMSAASVSLPTGDIATARRALESTPPEHRGWEFAHLYSRLDQSRGVLRPGVGGACVAADVPGLGLCVASAAGAARLDAAGTPTALDPRLRLWVAAHASVLPVPLAWHEGAVYWADERGALRTTPIGCWTGWPNATVQEARVSADGRTVAMRVSGAGHAVLVASLESGSCAAMDIDPAQPASRIELSADGRRVAAGFDAGGGAPGGLTLRIFDAATGRELLRTPELSRAPTSIALTAAGDTALLALHDGALERWELSADAARRSARLGGERDPARNLRLSPDGKLLVGGARDGIVRMWDAATLAPLAEMIGHETEVLGAGFQAGGAEIVTTGTDGTVRFWSPASPVPRPLVLMGHEHLVHGIAIGQGSRRVFTGSWDKTIAAYALDTGERTASATLSELVQHVALSPDERVIAVREYQSPARLLDAGTLRTLRQVQVDRSEDAAPLFSADSRRLVVGIAFDERVARVVDIETGEVRRGPLSELRGFVGPTICTPAGLIALSTMRDGQFVTAVCRLEDGRELLARPSLRIATESMTFAADGTRLAIVGEGNDIDLFETRGMTRVGTFRGHSREVLAMVFSPDGRRLFSADFTGVIRVWDTRTCDEVGQLRGHEAHIRRLAISPDGRCLVSGSRDGTARVWKVPQAIPTAITPETH